MLEPTPGQTAKAFTPIGSIPIRELSLRWDWLQRLRTPSFLAIHPSGRYLVPVNEVEHFQGEPSGAISAFAIDFGSGKLRLLNQIASLGAGPAHISLDLKLVCPAR